MNNVFILFIPIPELNQLNMPQDDIVFSNSNWFVFNNLSAKLLTSLFDVVTGLIF